MIYEIRTYQLVPGSLAEVEKRFDEAYVHRQKYSQLIAFWHTEIGPLNEIVHIWPYADLAERTRVRAAMAGDPNWPPKIGEFIVHMQSEILVPFPFLPELRPGRMGPIFELRYYTIKPGTLPAIMKGWETKIDERSKLSPVVLAGHVDIGEASRFIHVWAYRTMDERLAIRRKAIETAAWPPAVAGPPPLLTQANKILLPASFSPIQ